MRASILLAFLAVVLGSSTKADAQVQSTRVALLRFQVDGRLPDVVKQHLAERLIQGLAEAGFEVSAGEALTNVLRKGSVSECRTDPCYRQAAGSLGVDYLVTAEIEVRQRNYEFTLELINGRQGKPLGAARDRCELCGVEEARQRLASLASSLRKYRDTRVLHLSRLNVESHPSGAEVLVNGQPAGQTPLALELEAGRHELAFTARGHRNSTKTVETRTGSEALVSVDLAPVAVGSSAARVGSTRGYAWGAVAAGLLALAAAPIALTFDRDEIRCSKSADRLAGKTCRRDLGLVVGGLFGGGGVALAGGGLLLLFPASSF